MRRSSLCGLCVSVVNPVRRQSPSRIEPQRRGRERPAPPSISPSLRHCVIAPLRSLRAQPSSTQRRQDAETQRRRKGIQRAMNRCIWLLSVFCRLARAPGQQRIEVAGGATPACRQAGRAGGSSSPAKQGLQLSSPGTRPSPLQTQIPHEAGRNMKGNPGNHPCFMIRPGS